MRLKAVDCQEQQIRQKDIKRRPPEHRVRKSKRKADLIDEGIEKEARKGGGEVEMPRLGAPVGRLFVDDVVDEACEFGPQRPFLPEEAIDWDCECQT